MPRGPLPGTEVIVTNHRQAAFILGDCIAAANFAILNNDERLFKLTWRVSGLKKVPFGTRAEIARNAGACGHIEFVSWCADQGYPASCEAVIYRHRDCIECFFDRGYVVDSWLPIAILHADEIETTEYLEYIFSLTGRRFLSSLAWLQSYTNARKKGNAMVVAWLFQKQRANLDMLDTPWSCIWGHFTSVNNERDEEMRAFMLRVFELLDSKTRTWVSQYGTPCRWCQEDQAAKLYR